MSGAARRTCHNNVMQACGNPRPCQPKAKKGRVREIPRRAPFQSVNETIPPRDHATASRARRATPCKIPPPRARCRTARTPKRKSFLLLFYKKEGLTSLGRTKQKASSSFLKKRTKKLLRVEGAR